jgi:Flp pilus assembly protein TadD
MRDLRPILPALLLLCAAGCGGGEPTSTRETPPPAGQPVDPARRELLLRRGLQSLADGIPDQAVRLLEKAREGDPSSGEIGVALGRAYLAADRYAAARELLEEIAGSPEATPAQRVEARQVLSELFLKEGDLAGARTACAPLLGASPSARTLRIAGTIAYREGRQDEARARLEEAVRLDPSDAEAWTGLGLARLLPGDAAGAAAALEEAVRRDPENHTALSNLSKAYDRLGRAEEARAVRERYRAVYDLKSVRQKVGPLRARGVEAYDAGRMGEALRSFEEILALSPKDAQAHAQTGAVLLAMERHAEAERHLRAAIEIRPDEDFALTQLGRLLALRNDFPGAIEMLERAARANPHAPEPHYFLAGIYYAQRRREDFLRERAAYERLRGASPGGEALPLPGEGSP